MKIRFPEAICASDEVHDFISDEPIKGATAMLKCFLGQSSGFVRSRLLSSTFLLILALGAALLCNERGQKAIKKPSIRISSKWYLLENVIPTINKDQGVFTNVQERTIVEPESLDEWVDNSVPIRPSDADLHKVPINQRVLQTTNDTCTEECCLSQHACPVCNSTQEASNGSIDKIPSPLQYILILVLLLLSALFSGLTLGLMGLDITGLEIIISSDNKEEANYAKKILPIRKNGNQLLCTLVLGNIAVNSLTSILTADKFGGTIGFISSTFLIVIFGEIVPQAACSRHGLWVGAHSIPVVRFFMILLFPVAKPLAMGLDFMLGREILTIYSEAEMLKLFQIHAKENAIDHERISMMTGALQYKDRLVKDVMTPIDNTFMLNVDEKLNFETIAKVHKSGYSRIPVYEGSRDKVVGLLFVKDLIFIDPEDNTGVAEFVEIFGRHVHVVCKDDPLSVVLRELKKGRSHMALVRDVAATENSPSSEPYYELCGIITLEDIIEEILGEEIVDETDQYTDGTHSMTVTSNKIFDFGRLRLLDSKIVDQRLSRDEAKAVVAHLQKNHSSVVSLITDKQLMRLVMEESLVFNLHPSTEFEEGSSLPKELLYTKGVETDFCTLILSGKVTVIVGEENFHTDVSSWCLLAPGAIEKASYKPDFTAYVSGDGDCRCLRIMRPKFVKAVDASTFKRLGKIPEASAADS